MRQAAPYKALSDDYLATACSFCLAVLFVALVMFKVGTLVQFDELQKIMSLEQRSDFLLPLTTLTWIVIGSCAGALAVGTVVVVVQISRAGARMLAEQRSSNARKLRCVEDGDMVEVPKLPPDNFHIFLSHVWGAASQLSIHRPTVPCHVLPCRSIPQIPRRPIDRQHPCARRHRAGPDAYH